MKIAVIPARGGSKRIPRKNIRLFGGKPILAYSIEVARASGLFDRVVVSTDDDEIAAVARQWGGETPFVRPAQLADDHAGTNAVVKNAIEWFQGEGLVVSHACCIYATAPFLQVAYLRQGYEELQRSGKSFVFSVTRFPAPVQRALRVGSDGAVGALYPEFRQTRSQDLEPAYHDAAQFYWGTAAAFVDNHVLFSDASRAVILPHHLVQDIDTEEDWTRAEWMYRAGQLHQDSSGNPG